MLSAGPLEADTVLQTSVLSAESKRSEHAPKTNYERHRQVVRSPARPLTSNLAARLNVLACPEYLCRW